MKCIVCGATFGETLKSESNYEIQTLYKFGGVATCILHVSLLNDLAKLKKHNGETITRVKDKRGYYDYVVNSL